MELCLPLESFSGSQAPCRAVCVTTSLLVEEAGTVSLRKLTFVINHFYISPSPGHRSRIASPPCPHPHSLPNPLRRNLASFRGLQGFMPSGPGHLFLLYTPPRPRPLHSLQRLGAGGPSLPGCVTFRKLRDLCDSVSSSANGGNDRIYSWACWKN